MSQKTRMEVLAWQRGRYARAGKEHKTRIINERVELFGYHRKAAIRALQPRPVRQECGNGGTQSPAVAKRNPIGIEWPR